MGVFTYYESPIGRITIAADGGKIVGLWLEGQRSSVPLEETPQKSCDIPVLDKAAKWLDSYFKGEKPDISGLELSLSGSEFQLMVWEELLKIPYGGTAAYGEIARNIAYKKGVPRMSSQAVGGAVGRNPISIIIPCHRVIGAGGKLTGYAGGLDKKEWLLRHEGSLT